MAPRHATTESRLSVRLSWGGRWGLYYGAALSVLATVGYVLKPSGFAQAGLNYPEVVAFYVIGGPVAGLIVGLLRPVTASVLGAAIVGIVTAVPIGFALTIMLAGMPWTRSHTILVTILILSG